MEVKYYSYGQAAAISADYQHLIGSAFNKGQGGNGSTAIQEIIVAPYSKILQWKFVYSLMHGIPYEDAIRICVNGRYDVLVLAGPAPAHDKDYEVKALRDYLQEHEIPVNFGIYKCLRSM